MKKNLLIAFAAMLFAVGCQKNQTAENPGDELETLATADRAAISIDEIYERCAADHVLKQQLKDNPGFAKRRQDIENFTNRIASDPSFRLAAGGIIEIPVVVNVLYNNAAEDISLAQIQTQIDVLNADFSAANSDYDLTPAIYQGLRSDDFSIRFVLSNVVRKSSKKKSWRPDDSMKFSKKGGINATDPQTTLNIWVCNLSNSLLGYAQFPGGNPASDGVVCDTQAFGTTGTAQSPFNKGRTATHEVGHWLNLYHIWGDDGSACTGSDQVADTPNQAGYNFGCPTFPKVTCNNQGDMSMNYMDYTDDGCMYMFTAGQKARALAIFAAGGPRAAFAQ